MILKKAILTNYRGINGSKEIKFDLFNCIVGQNDAGKSTILKALDIFLNGTKPTKADLNVQSDGNNFSVELFFDCRNRECNLGEQISTTLEKEELTNSENLLVIKKIWPTTEANVGNPKISILRKKYAGQSDFILLPEAKLIKLCTDNSIPTTKGNGEEFNNVEKRQKLREYNHANNIRFTYEYEEIPTSGQTKGKAIGDAIEDMLPAFQYFKADTSLSDTDATIQKYFKDMATRLIDEEADTDAIEEEIKTQLRNVLNTITDKINSVVKTTETVEPKIDFDWSKLITTSFVSKASGSELPLSSRGDGFRRITMMSYFEYLAETKRTNGTQQIIFGFEEPETFLHPSGQENLFHKLTSLTENGYQVLLTTHSPSIVGNAKRNQVIHITKPDNVYTINQTGIDFKELAIDLGIKPDNTFAPLFSTSRLLFLVEGIDDVKAMQHNASLYKQAGLIANTFEELNINIIPIGGSGGVKHWVNLDLFTKLEKPYFIFLDSDKTNATATSENLTNLTNYGLTLGVDFHVTKKRLLENYIHPTALQRLVPGAAISYTDFDHAKNICRDYPDDAVRGQLGGKHVAERHYCSLSFDELRMTWNNGTDEFIDLYNTIIAKLN